MTDARTPVPLATLLEHRGFVRALARSLVADAARADDVEQQVWADAVRNPPAEDRGVAGWLARVVRRRARDQRRGERRFADAIGRAAFERTAPAPGDVVAQAEVAERLVRLVLALDEPYRTTVLLRFYEDLPVEEVARRMDVPPETVRTRTRRAAERLRSRMGGGDPERRRDWLAAVAVLAGDAAVGIDRSDGSGGSGAPRRAPGRRAAEGSLGGAAGGALMAGMTTIVTVAALGIGAGGALGWTLRGGGTTEGPPAVAGVPTARVPDRPWARAAARAETPPAQAEPAPAATVPDVAPASPVAVRPIRGRVVTVSGEHVAGAVVWAVPRDEGPFLKGTDASVELRNLQFAGCVATLRAVRLRAAIETRSAQDGTFELPCREDSAHAVWVFPANAQVKAPAGFAADSVAPGETVEFVVLPTGADQLRARVLDPRLSSAERIEAFSKLERRSPLDDEALRAVVDLLRAAEARDRATILRELHGKKASLLVEPLLACLRDDPDEEVREEAAETLDDYLAEPRVLEALTAARDGDPSRKVREQAAESLAGGERKGR